MATSRPSRLLARLVLVMLANCALGQQQAPEKEAPSPSKVAVPIEAVPPELLRSALEALAKRNSYESSQLVEAVKSVERPYEVYRLRLRMRPRCELGTGGCFPEDCSLEVRRQLRGSDEGGSDDEGTSAGEPLCEVLEQSERAYVAVRPDHCPGCPYELSPSLPGLEGFVEQALRAMDEASPGDFRHKLLGLLRVSRAVPPNANIVRYQLLLQVAESACLKSSLVQLSECALLANLPARLCLVTFEQPAWRPEERRLAANNCTDPQADNDLGDSRLQPAVEQPAVEQPAPEPDDQLAQEARQPSERMRQFDQYLEDFEPRPKRDLSRKQSKPLARKLALAALELLDRQEARRTRRHLLELLDAQREREASGLLLYRLTLRVGPTDCPEAEPLNGECLDEVLPGPLQLCKLSLAVDEKKPLLAPKLLHHDCKYERKPEERLKRESNGLGAPRPHDPRDPQIQKFIELGLQQYSRELEGSYEPVVSNVRNVSVQVVAGLLYRIDVDIGLGDCRSPVEASCQTKSAATEAPRQCTIEAWSQPWMDQGNAKIKVKCERPERRKRSLRGANYSERMLQQARQLKEEKLFHAFIDKYDKRYESDEEKQRRFAIFRQNLDMIEELQRNEQGTARYGVTQFSDLTKAEFKARYLGLRPSLRSDNDIPLPMAQIPDVQLPEQYDWRHYNVVTPVKNQGSCGSCWAFSVTGNVEGQYAIKHGKLLSLSEQELVDCDKFDDGCNGGLPDTAYRAIEELGGLETESDYPYDAQDEKCHFDKNKVKVAIVSGLNITSNETQMAQWLVKNGPMSIGINANAMQFYMGGVSHPFKFLCSPDDLDHGVLIVGYGVRSYPIFKKAMPYWLIKNSWGPHWGEQGYYRVYRGDGTCGVNKMVTSAIVA